MKGPDRVCVRLAVQLRLFHALAGNDGRLVSAAELSETSGAEKLLIGKFSSSEASRGCLWEIKFLSFAVRIMRVLTASKFVGEAGPENYIATPLTKIMTNPPIESAARFMSVSQS